MSCVRNSFVGRVAPAFKAQPSRVPFHLPRQKDSKIVSLPGVPGAFELVASHFIFVHGLIFQTNLEGS